MIQIIQFFGFILVKNLRIPGIKQKSYSVSFVSHKLPLKNCIQVTIQYNKATCLKITCFLHDLLVRHKTILRLDKIINNLQTLELWCVQERHYCVIVWVIAIDYEWKLRNAFLLYFDLVSRQFSYLLGDELVINYTNVLLRNTFLVLTLVFFLLHFSNNSSTRVYNDSEPRYFQVNSRINTKSWMVSKTFIVVSELFQKNARILHLSCDFSA